MDDLFTITLAFVIGIAAIIWTIVTDKPRAGEFYSHRAVVVVVIIALVLGAILGWFTAPYGFMPVRS